MKNIDFSKHFDYKTLLRFTIPSILMMMFMNIFSVIDDGLFVSNFVGKDAFVAINMMSPILGIISALGYMISSGGNAIVSKTLGEHQEMKANQYFSMIVYFSILLSIVISILSFIFIKPICIALKARGAVLDNCLLYGRILSPFIVLFMLQNVFQTFLITAKKPTFAMNLTIANGVINIAFDTLLIVILKLGIVGAIWATLSGTIITGLIPLFFFIYSKDSQLKLVRTHIDLRFIKKSCFNGISQLISTLSASIAAIVFNYLLMDIAGNDGVGAYGVMIYCSFVFQAAFQGYSTGISPVMSYNLGARNFDELKSLFKKSMIIICNLGIILALASQIIAVPFSKIFVSYDVTLLNMTVHGLRIYTLSLLFSGISLFTSAFFTALNEGLIAGIISFIRTFVIQIISVFMLSSLFGLEGIWLSCVISEVLSSIISIIMLYLHKDKYHYI